MKRNFISLILFFSVIGHPQAQPLRVGDYMPTFNFWSGYHLSSSTDFRGKIVVVNFWASWCEPCRRELACIQNQLYNSYQYNSKVVFLIFGVSETARTLAAYQYINGLNLPMYADTDKEIYKLFGDTYFPSTFIISPNSRIYFHSNGFAGNLDEINWQINSLLR